MLNNVFINPSNRKNQLDRVIISNKLNESNEHTRINKFNPDVVNNYNRLVDKRNNNVFKITNNPYKNITNDNNKNVKNSKDLIIDIRQSDKNLLDELNKLSNERNYDNNNLKEKFNEEKKMKHLDLFKKNNNNKNKLQNSLNNNFKDHTLLKTNMNDHLLKSNFNLNKEKKKYDDIVNSLIDEGLL